MEIIHKDYGRGGEFLAVEDGFEMGEMTYVWGGDEKIIIDHTGVSPKYSNQGIGKELVKSAVEFAREKNIKVVPLCTFAKAIMQRDKSLQDVL